MTLPRILIAGIGNIFFGDDAFGVEVVRGLLGRPVPSGVRAIDFGIRGLDLAYALTDGYDAAILVDAMQRGGDPGTLYVIEPDLANLPECAPTLEPHALDPWRVLSLARSLGGMVERAVVVGCEPATLEPEDGAFGLSGPVQASVAEAMVLIESLVAKMRATEMISPVA